MPVKIGNQTYYRTAEACRMAGTSKNTYVRWVAMGVLEDVKLRDRRGWRLFSQRELERLIAEVNRVQMPSKAEADVPAGSS